MERTPNSTHSRRSPLRAAVALAATAGVIALTSAASAQPSVAAEPGGAQKVAELTKQIKSLEKEYGGNLEQLRDARQDAKKALEKARLLKDDLDNAQELVAQLATAQYMSSGVDPTVYMIAGGDPSDVLSNASLASHLSQNQSVKVRQIAALVDQQEEAGKEAEEKIDKLEKDIEDISKERERVKLLLKKYKPESPLVGSGGMTPRMIKVKDEIEAEYGPFPVIGCTRPGDPLDHGSGRACDFMESTAGQMPSQDRVEHGDAVADYAIKNASRLGVKYIIWKQRIWDVRAGGGWDPMSDRGSITQNHFDHVHISVF